MRPRAPEADRDHRPCGCVRASRTAPRNLPPAGLRRSGPVTELYPERPGCLPRRRESNPLEQVRSSVLAAPAGTRRRRARSPPRSCDQHELQRGLDHLVGHGGNAEFPQLPDSPGFGISRWRTGSGRNVPAFSWARRSSRNSRTPVRCSTSRTVMPSTPGVFAPRLPSTRNTPHTVSPGRARS
jgi:hypothetical protein